MAFGILGCKKSPNVNFSKIAGTHTLVGVDSVTYPYIGAPDTAVTVLLKVTIYVIDNKTIVTTLNGGPRTTGYQTDTLHLVTTNNSANTVGFSYSTDLMDFGASDYLLYNYVTNTISQTQIIYISGETDKLELSTP